MIKLVRIDFQSNLSTLSFYMSVFAYQCLLMLFMCLLINKHDFVDAKNPLCMHVWVSEDSVFQSGVFLCVSVCYLNLVSL